MDLIGWLFVLAPAWIWIIGTTMVWLFGFNFLGMQTILVALISTVVFHSVARLHFIHCRLRRSDFAVVDYISLIIAVVGLATITDIERKIAELRSDNLKSFQRESLAEIRRLIDGVSSGSCQNAKSNAECDWAKKSIRVYEEAASDHEAGKPYNAEKLDAFIVDSFNQFEVPLSKGTWLRSNYSWICLRSIDNIGEDGVLIENLHDYICPSLPDLHSLPWPLDDTLESMYLYHERRLTEAWLRDYSQRQRDPLLDYLGYFILAVALAMELTKITAERRGWYADKKNS